MDDVNFVGMFSSGHGCSDEQEWICNTLIEHVYLWNVHVYEKTSTETTDASLQEIS